MPWTWMLLAVAATGLAWVVFLLQRDPRRNEDRCPYRIGTDRVDCVGPCETEPPCLFL
ncbi:MAG: hypothetical protein Kow0092_34280 [Deferrisomatales bacterium]